MQRAAKLAPGETPPPPVVQVQFGTGADLTARFEGFRATKFDFGTTGPEIGFGHRLSATELATGRIQVGTESIPFLDGISEEQGRRILEQDMGPAYKTVDDLIKVPLTPGQRDALADLVFNIGPRRFASSELLALLNQGKYEEVPAQIERLSLIRGRTFPDLELRRQAEADLWKRSPRPAQQTAPSKP
jgi:lysozyme